MTTLASQPAAKRIAKKDLTIYWIFTGLIVLLDGLIPALTFNSKLAVEGIRHLGYPDYFRIELSIAKVIGAIALILPMVPARIKEWAYAGFGITFISAAIGNAVVDGIGGSAFMPLVGLLLLTISYIYYLKVRK